MKKLMSLIPFLFISALMNIYAQTMPTLAILPLSNDGGDYEEALSELIAGYAGIRNTFTLVESEGTFTDIIADSERSFGADFVIAVHNQKVWSTNIATFSLINAETLQLISGDYRHYWQTYEIYGMLSYIVGEILSGMDFEESLPRLAVMPAHGDLNREEAELLLSIVTIELANSGKYAVFPWSVPDSIEIKDSYFNIIDQDLTKEIGNVTSASYILASDILSMGTTNLFRTGIVGVESGHFVSEGDIEYRNIAGDLQLFTRLASHLLHIDTIFGETSEFLAGLAEMAETQAAADYSALPYTATEEDFRAKFVLIEGGTFMMGSPLSEISRDSDEVQHSVTLKSFYMGKFPVTQAEYEAVTGNNPSHFRGADLPVDQINWFDAIIYCNARSIKEGLTPVYTISEEKIIWDHSANGYRLPMEAEWEYAARAGTVTAFNVGETITTAQANFDGNYPFNRGPVGVFRRTTTPMGTFPPNAWGLYDMHGNVYEWCWDQYNPYGVGGLDGSVLERAVIRGGCWYSEARFLRSANRVRTRHVVRSNLIGLRVVRSVF